MRILLVEDDLTLGDAVRTHTSRQGHAVDWAKDLENARACLGTVQYGLILLDLRLPDGRGIDLLKELRAKREAVPVIILTAHDQISDRIAGLNAGADDYLVKPFDLGELEARVHAVARRYTAHQVPMIRLQNLQVFPSERRIEKDEGGELSLSSREWAVLDALCARPQAIVAKTQIEEALYAFGAEIESNTVEVYVSRLRRKLGHSIIQTVRGIGYRIAIDDQQRP
ncbi:response regulator transcription factor [Rhizobium sp. FY34]|uniref:response regulator transcription factor n=1 Tax=Rhizobium sp. FY34 TaxID=2562309 RepID=UPI0010C13C44|nr:response regulator transcription factor [Rhizobium sp. FY34]